MAVHVWEEYRIAYYISTRQVWTGERAEAFDRWDRRLERRAFSSPLYLSLSGLSYFFFLTRTLLCSSHTRSATAPLSLSHPRFYTIKSAQHATASAIIFAGKSLLRGLTSGDPRAFTYLTIDKSDCTKRNENSADWQMKKKKKKDCWREWMKCIRNIAKWCMY